MKFKIILIAILGIAAALFAAYVFYERSQIENIKPRQLEINSKVVYLDIVESIEDRKKGLSGRSSYPKDRGMLFVFEESGPLGIWMKDMLFSIDIMWLDENYNVITIYKNVTPDTYPAVFLPRRDARYVLETASGFVDEHKIFEGLHLNIK